MSRVSRVSSLIRTGSVALALLSAVASASAGDLVTVTLDRAKMVRVPDGTQTLIIGNPLIADVTLLKGNNSMVLTGRSFGTTNLILLDAAGAPIAESTIQVSSAPGALTMVRAGQRESYSCTPRCAPTVALGDEGRFMNDSINNVRARAGAAASGGR